MLGTKQFRLKLLELLYAVICLTQNLIYRSLYSFNVDSGKDE